VLTVPYWPLRGRRARRLTLLGSALLLFVVLLNRRTVWLALLVGVAVVMLRKRRLGPRGAMLVAIAALVTVALYVAFPEAGPRTEPVAQSATGTGTLEWRMQGWSVLFASWSTDPVHWFLGQPFGSGFARTDLGPEVQAEPHNFYFSTLLRMGLVGVLSLIALTGGLLRALWRIPTRGDGLLGPGLFPALLTMQVIWFITWVPGMEQGIITGLAVGLAARGVREGHLAFPHAGRWTTRNTPAGARPSRSPAGDGTDPGGTSISAGERR
jgi:O-antigen ligase